MKRLIAVLAVLVFAIILLTSAYVNNDVPVKAIMFEPEKAIIARSEYGSASWEMQGLANKLLQKDGDAITINSMSVMATDIEETEEIFINFNAANISGLEGFYVLRIGFDSTRLQQPNKYISIDSASLKKEDDRFLLNLFINNSADAEIELLYSKKPAVIKTWTGGETLRKAHETYLFNAQPISKSLLNRYLFPAEENWHEVEVRIDPVFIKESEKIDVAEQVFNFISGNFSVDNNEYLWNLNKINKNVINTTISEVKKLRETNNISYSVKFYLYFNKTEISVGERSVAILKVPIGIKNQEGIIYPGEVSISVMKETKVNETIIKIE